MKVKVYIYNLGCPKNQVDGEYMAGYLSEAEEIELVEEYQQADIIAVNTCGFIETAKEESIEAIMEAVRLKEEGSCRKVIVTGCLSQRYHKEIEEEIPEIDGLFGIGDHQNFLKLVQEVEQGKKVTEVNEPSQHLNKDIPRLHKDNGFAYLKIADGCDQNCTYCTIPSIKGSFQSRGEAYIIKEAKQLSQGGIKEINLVAQDTALYGIDIYGESHLYNLLKELSEIPKIEWIRLMYTYPEHLEEKVIKLIASEIKICNYLDLPIQHSSGPIRKLMGRPGDSNSLKEKIKYIRSIIPDIALRTSLIVGFPGETEEDFQELEGFIQEIKFDRLGVFTYSQEENTAAAKLPNQIPEKLKIERYNRIMEIQQSIAREKNQQLVGQTLPVIVEEIKNGTFIGRTVYDAPEIDNAISGPISNERDITVGEIYLAKIKTAFEYDLEGEIINENE